MVTFKQTFTVLGPELRKLGTIKRVTQHSPLKNNDGNTLKLAQEMYGANVARVELAATEVSR